MQKFCFLPEGTESVLTSSTPTSSCSTFMMGSLVSLWTAFVRDCICWAVSGPVRGEQPAMQRPSGMKNKQTSREVFKSNDRQRDKASCSKRDDAGRSRGKSLSARMSIPGNAVWKFHNHATVGGVELTAGGPGWTDTDLVDGQGREWTEWMEWTWAENILSGLNIGFEVGRRL